MEQKRILILGAAGSVGSELVRQLKTTNVILAADQEETGLFDLGEVEKKIVNIRDADALADMINEFKPEIVFHAAAYKHVEMSEENIVEAIKTNVIGTINVGLACLNAKVKKLVFISTDKAVNPTSVMGITKLLGEKIIKKCGYISVRFGNVLGSRGSVIPIWQKQIERGEPISVTDERMERFFMTMEEACELVIRAAEIGEGGELFILDMGKPIKILEIAQKIIKETRQDIPIKFIGIREGEKLTEELMTKEEEKIATKKDKFYIIK